MRLNHGAHDVQTQPESAASIVACMAVPEILLTQACYRSRAHANAVIRDRKGDIGALPVNVETDAFVSASARIFDRVID